MYKETEHTIVQSDNLEELQHNTDRPDFNVFGQQFIILDSNKHPQSTFKDPKDRLTFKLAKDFQNIGLVVPKGYCVIDFDTEDDANKALAVVRGLCLKTWIMWSTRGVHLWFKIPEGETLKNMLRGRLAIGLHSDRKTGETASFVMIKRNGSWREWELCCDFEEIEEMPLFFRGVDAGQKFDFSHMKSGDGRNDVLFSYIPILEEKNYDKESIITILSAINDYIFDEPLPDDEMAMICRDDAFKTGKQAETGTETPKTPEIQKKTTPNDDETGFKFYNFGDDLIDKLHIVYYHNQFFIYDNGYYKLAGSRIEKAILKEMKLNQHQRSEVLTYMRIQSTIEDDEYEPDPYIITAKNVRINLKTDEIIQFSPDFVEFTKLPAKYDPHAKCEAVDQLLNNVFLGREKLIDLFIEFLGAIIVKNAKIQKAVLMVGGGANGKSTILKMLEKFIGRGNYSTIPLEKLGDRFYTAELDHKLANIGDDISCTEPITETSAMKKLITGDELSAERKGQPLFSMVSYATHFYSCNSIPRSFDKTDGFYRRWSIIPFDASFKPDMPGFDPSIEEKVTTPEALSYLLNLAIQGARKIIKNDKISEPEEVKIMEKAYRASNSTVLQWIDEEELDDVFFLKHPSNELYDAYKSWCKDAGIYETRIVSRIGFNTEVKMNFKFEQKTRQRSDGKRYYVPSI